MSNHPCGPEHGFRVDCIKYYSAIEKRQKELEAENARLRQDYGNVCQKNLRLRNAGDLMFYNLSSYMNLIGDNGNIHKMIVNSCDGWKEATK